MPSMSTRGHIRGNKISRSEECNTIDEALEQEVKEIPPCTDPEDINITRFADSCQNGRTVGIQGTFANCQDLKKRILVSAQRKFRKMYAQLPKPSI